MILTVNQIAIIKEYFKPFEPKRLAVFGSYARGEAKKSSDLDLLVHFDRRISLFDIIDLEDKLSDALGVKVDLVTEKSLNPMIKPFILNDLIVL